MCTVWNISLRHPNRRKYDHGISRNLQAAILDVMIITLLVIATAITQRDWSIHNKMRSSGKGVQLGDKSLQWCHVIVQTYQVTDIAAVLQQLAHANSKEIMKGVYYYSFVKGMYRPSVDFRHTGLAVLHVKTVVLGLTLTICALNSF